MLTDVECIEDKKDKVRERERQSERERERDRERERERESGRERVEREVEAGVIQISSASWLLTSCTVEVCGRLPTS